MWEWINSHISVVVCSSFEFGTSRNGVWFIATFLLSSVASLNLGRSQNAVLGNGLIATFLLSSAASVNLGRSQNGVPEDGLRSLENEGFGNVVGKGDFAGHQFSPLSPLKHVDPFIF